MLTITLFLLSWLAAVAKSTSTYTLSLEKDTSPIISILNEKGKGFTPCNYTFNPAWIEPSEGTNDTAGMLLRAAQCPPEFGGPTDHILMVKCDAQTGACEDVLPTPFPFEDGAEDPRVVYDKHTGFYFLWYFANPPSGSPPKSQNTVYLRRSKTPFEPDSWERVGPAQPWHRNGCSFPLKHEGAPRYIIVGEAPNPGLPAIGLWKSIDGFQTFTPVNKTYLPVPFLILSINELIYSYRRNIRTILPVIIIP